MSFLDDVWDAVSTEPFSFMIGALVGYLASVRYRVVRVRRNGGDDDGQLRRPDRS